MTNDKAAELLAAVRAVESGEASAASFFTAPQQAPAPRAAERPAATPAPRPEDAGPVPVPEDVPALLAEGGAPGELAPQVAEALGAQAAEVLRADPWQLLAVREVRPEQADGFARALLGEECGPEDGRRVRAMAVRVLEDAARKGHTVLEPGALTKALEQYGVPDPEEAVRGAVDEGAVLVFEDALEEGGAGASGAGASGAGAAGTGAAAPAAGDAGEGEDAEEERPVRMSMGLDRYALAEETVADGLARLTSTFRVPEEAGAAQQAEEGAATEEGAGEDPSEAADAQEGAQEGGAPPAPTAEAWEEAAQAAPSPSAAELIRAAAGHGLVAHTGGEAARAEPAALVAAARGLGLRAYAAAHTENGRLRLARQLGDGGEEAVLTVAGLLAGREGPARGEYGAWELDVLTVCDAPQLDAETAAALVESLPDGARLVLSGDPQVLGSAGPGRVFADVLAARTCPVLASRTPDPGPVGELVSGIGIGELQQVEAPGKEVVIVPVRDPGEAVHRTVQLVADSVPRAIGVPSERTQVVTVGHGGPAGTRALNAALKERINPGPGRFGGFDPGDRVAHSPAPGRTALGSVVSADETGLQLNCAGRQLTVPKKRVAQTVRHGWAVTAHQAAGSRWPAAVVVLPGDAAPGLTREWVYTAFGRGERHLSVVHGVEDALPRAVQSAHVPERSTRLRGLLAQAAREAAAPAAETAGPAA
ncbi:helix-hairpin-helix domain-containing protein [Streptomyces sp. ODS28]|uniref:helix-hairpin-helix domain-containing protein n=1 Tax=Streptomyces sp. ODS28 TaxID=3136688 RepID=UPI0031ED77BD